MSEISHIDGLNEFLDGKRLMNFADFQSSAHSGVVIVIGCYLGVEEGVDMWRDHQSEHDDPRFRLRITVGDYNGESSFLLRDDMVKQIAPITCKLLVDTSQGSSVYPVELDSMFGDPFILEVDGQSSDYLDGSAAYNVLRVFTDSNLLDVFLKFSDYFSVVQPKEAINSHLPATFPLDDDLPEVIDDLNDVDGVGASLGGTLCNLPSKKGSGQKRKRIESCSEVIDDNFCLLRRFARAKRG